MLARVVCCKCHKNLKVKKIIEKGDTMTVIIESCSALACSATETLCDIKDFEKHLSDMLRERPFDDIFLEIDR